MSNKKLLTTICTVAAGAALAAVVMGFQMPQVQVRFESQSRPQALPLAPALEVMNTTPAVKDGTHYEIPLALVQRSL